MLDKGDGLIEKGRWGEEEKPRQQARLCLLRLRLIFEDDDDHDGKIILVHYSL